MEKLIRPGLFGLKAILIIVGTFLLLTTVARFDSAWEKIKAETILTGNEPYTDFVSYLTGTMNFSTAVVILVVAVIAIFGIVTIATDFKKGMKFIIGLVGLGIIVAVVYYGMANDAIDPNWETKSEITPDVSRWSDAGIKISLFLAFAGVGLAVLGEVIGFIKNR